MSRPFKPVYITEVTTKEELKTVMDGLKSYAHPVLNEAQLYMFWGATTLVRYEGPRVVSLHQSKIGKRKKNIWEPVVNWYGAFTVPDQRGRGHATALYRQLEAIALDRGCRRVKSLAGSAAGLGLHRSLGHQCWGLTDKNECWINSPLPGHESLYSGLVPHGAPEDRPWSGFQIEEQIKIGLRYD